MNTPVVDSLGSRARRICVDARLLSVDLEAYPGGDQRIFAIGAVRAGHADGFGRACSSASAPAVIAALNDFSQGSGGLVGHNVRRHDIPLMEAQLPQLACLRWPLLDTLELSAPAFPSNPYHRLVKGYKLITEERNNPTKDARVALDVCEEAVHALLEADAAPWWPALLHGLLEGDPGMAMLLSRICETTPPARAEPPARVRQHYAAAKTLNQISL
ncbi:MAG: hypothetical protein REJ50_06790 [Bordetella sp.]|nr:hypothetical protein [Bordetella sp.]